ncbi:MAG: LacI family DNA-binding transcriptional regulator [Chloroflexota bacterium]
MSKNKVTLADIAEITGLSTSTVSRALNDSSLIPEATKQLVRTVADETNYRPHLGARNFRLQKSFNIGVVIPIEASHVETLSNPFVLEFIGSVGTALRQHDYNLLLIQENRLNEHYWQSGLVDGFIQLGHGLDRHIMESLPDDMPFVVWGPYFPDRPYVSVGINNTELSHQVVQHLITQGRRKIAIIVGERYQQSDTEPYQRMLGYRHALEEADLHYDDSLVGLANFDTGIGYHAAQSLLNNHPDIDAIFVASGDLIALAVIEAIRQMGKNVPDDIAIVSFDNCHIGVHCSVPLTTVSQEVKSGGAKALVDALLTQIDGQSVQPFEIEGKIIIRQSSGV